MQINKILISILFFSISFTVLAQKNKEQTLLKKERLLYEAGYTNVKVKLNGKIIVVKLISTLKLDNKAKGWKWSVRKEYDMPSFTANDSSVPKFDKTYNYSSLKYNFPKNVNVQKVLKIIRPFMFSGTFMTLSRKFSNSILIFDAQINLKKIHSSLLQIERLLKDQK